MKKSILTILLAALVSAAAAGQNATAVYVEGDASRRDVSGRMSVLDIGDGVKSGETVMTKITGRADLELENRSTITVRPDTVFTLGELEQDGEKQTVLSTVVGSVAFRLNRFAGRGPVIRTNNIVAGVRGTEFTVYAGMDGSSLLVVDKGEVEVSSQGAAVSLLADEAVEVRPGQAPGEKFTWIGKEQDFRSWNDGKLEEFLKEPVAVVERIERQLEVFYREAAYHWGEYEKNAAELVETRRKLSGINTSEGKDAAEKYMKESVEPLLGPTRTAALNTRYYALSALSMRRFVLGYLYLEVMTNPLFVEGKENKTEFLGIYRRILNEYEKSIVPRLVEADI